jgi:putative hemolysin
MMLLPLLKRVCPFLLVLVLLAPPASAMLNPAAVYCDALGHRYVTQSTREGDFGYCILPDGTKADAWEFFAGLEGQKFGACAEAGYRQETSSDPLLCPFSRCAVCIMPGGTRMPAARLLNLSYAETSCGDGTCGNGEDAVSCPADCRSGDLDNLCDGVRDGRCDPDCPDGKGDPDCVTAPDMSRLLVYLVPVLIVLAGAGAYVYLKKKKSL